MGANPARARAGRGVQRRCPRLLAEVGVLEVADGAGPLSPAYSDDAANRCEYKIRIMYSLATTQRIVAEPPRHRRGLLAEQSHARLRDLARP
jgi:hypothetical protein